jgi:hypothetical protein
MRAFFAIVCLLLAATARADVGIGASVASNDATIYVPITTSRLMIEPYIRYFDTELTFGSSVSPAAGPREQQFENYDVGVGIFGVRQPKDRVAFYYGGRVAYSTQLQETTFADLSIPNPILVNRTDLDGYQIVPAVGLTYSVIERLSIGVEVGWVYSELDGEELYSSSFSPPTNVDHELTATGTRAAVILRFFF